MSINEGIDLQDAVSMSSDLVIVRTIVKVLCYVMMPCHHSEMHLDQN